VSSSYRIYFVLTFVVLGSVLGCQGDPPATRSLAQLTSCTPSTALPGQKILLRGVALTSGPDADGVTVYVEELDMNFPLSRVSEREADFLVPPLPAGNYEVSLLYPDDTASTSCTLTVRTPSAPTLTPREAASRVSQNLRTVNDIIGTSLDSLVSEAGLAESSRTALMNASNDLGELVDDIESDIAALSTEQLAMLEHLLSETSLLDDPDDFRGVLRERMRPAAPVHATLFALDALGFATGNLSAASAIIGWGAVAVTLASGGTAAPLLAVAAPLLKASTALGIMTSIINAIPCDLQQLRVEENPIVLYSGQSLEPTFRGDFAAEGTFGDVIQSATLSIVLGKWKSIPIRGNNQYIRAGINNAIDRIGDEFALALDNIRSGFAIPDFRASPIENVQLDMELYDVDLDGLLALLTPALGPLSQAMSITVSFFGLPNPSFFPAVVPSDSSLLSVSPSDSNLLQASDVGARETEITIHAFRFSEVSSSGRSGLDAILPLLGDFFGIVLPESVERVVAVDILDSGPRCGDFDCEAPETCETCAIDCGECPEPPDDGTIVFDDEQTAQPPYDILVRRIADEEYILRLYEGDTLLREAEFADDTDDDQVFVEGLTETGTLYLLIIWVNDRPGGSPQDLSDIWVTVNGVVHHYDQDNGLDWNGGAYGKSIRLRIEPGSGDGGGGGGTGLPESAHPYDNSFDDTWVYTLPGTHASIDVTFDLLTETESCCDHIYVMDGGGNEISGSPFGGDELAGVTVNVPGDTVRIRLTTDGSVTRWGFRVTDVADGGGGTGLPESAHPYDNSFDDTWVYTLPGTHASIDVTFDSLTETESCCDHIYVMDGGGNEISGSPFGGDELAGVTVNVPGDTVRIRLTTDGSVTRWGFRVGDVNDGG
jgi:hypothetical protein